MSSSRLQTPSTKDRAPTNAPRNVLPTTKLFSSLPGSWKLDRYVYSNNPQDPNGRFDGTASFTRRPAPVDPAYVAELLYSEEGFMELLNPAQWHGGGGPRLRWTRKYIWRLSRGVLGEENDGRGPERISVWFVKPGSDEGREEADYLFHELKFEEKEEVLSMRRVVNAEGDHLCVDDKYKTNYVFIYDPGESGDYDCLDAFKAFHNVSGPKKEQTIRNEYYRQNEKL